MKSYVKHFRVGQPVKVGIHLDQNILFEDHGTVRGMEEDRMKLELWGAGLAERGGAQAGADVTVITESGYSVYRCSALLENEAVGRNLSLVLSGGICEKQLREHFRFDVYLPLAYAIPENQALAAVTAQWEMNRIRLRDIAPPETASHADGFRVVRWGEREELLPERINLSGGGLRFRMPEYTEPGTLMELYLFLPLVPARVIHVVAEVLRSTEMMLFWTSGNFFSTALRFHCIDEKDRETIISHIFMEQRRSLQVLKTAQS